MAIRGNTYFAEGLIVAASCSVRRLISSALKLFMSRGNEKEVVGGSLLVCLINAIEGPSNETATRAIMSPTMDFQFIQVTKRQ